MSRSTARTRIKLINRNSDGANSERTHVIILELGANSARERLRVLDFEQRGEHSRTEKLEVGVVNHVDGRHALGQSGMFQNSACMD